MAKYIISRVEEEYEKPIIVNVERYRYNMNNKSWELMFTYKVNDEKVKNILKKCIKEEPTMYFYMYRCYDIEGGIQGTIYTSHIYLFD